MPLYDFECPEHGRFELILSMKQHKGTARCPQCDRCCKQIIVPGHGGIQCDSENDVKWLASARKTLQPDGEKPIETRSEYKKYLKDHHISPKA